MSKRRSLLLGATFAAVAGTALYSFAQTSESGGQESMDRGRYLVKIAGCNDCHTPGYAMMGGNVPENEWLTGDRLGWRGPWGTTYPINLRLYMQDLTEDQWIQVAQTVQSRPPMPWFALHDMSQDDLRAIYRFMRSLGPAGEPAPNFVPPDQEPKGPYILFPAAPE
ncbi:MAG: cytochrome C [Woeseiaceae bacterium]